MFTECLPCDAVECMLLHKSAILRSAWFFQMEEARQQENTSSQETGSGRNQVTELAREHTTLEIELQTQLSTVSGSFCPQS